MIKCEGIKIKLLYCLIYFFILGMLGFLIGRLLPKRWFCYRLFPYRAYNFEHDGNVYKKLKIQKWMHRVPDMSKILPRTMPSKKLDEDMTADIALVMIRETCVAEFIHKILSVMGIGCLFIWKSKWALILYIIYVVIGNMPFVIIQRYIRPKLIRIRSRLQRRENTNTPIGDMIYANSNSKL